MTRLNLHKIRFLFPWTYFLEGLNWLKERAAADGEATIIIYYSGHGWLEKTNNRYYLLPHDIKPFDIPGSALSSEDFTSALRQIQAQRLLVIVDSCHAVQEWQLLKTEEPLLRSPRTLCRPPPQRVLSIASNKARVGWSSLHLGAIKNPEYDEIDR